MSAKHPDFPAGGGVQIVRDAPAPPNRKVYFGVPDRSLTIEQMGNTLILYYERSASAIGEIAKGGEFVGGDLAMSPDDADAFAAALREVARQARAQRRKDRQ